MDEQIRVKSVRDDNPFVLPVAQAHEHATNEVSRVTNLKHDALAVESLFAQRGINIKKTSSLGSLIAKTKGLNTDSGQSSWEDFFFTMIFYRLSSAILFLANEKGIDRYLKQLASQSLDLLSRKRSLGKDFLWELELFSLLKMRGLVVELLDPPDILWHWDGMRIGIACKKIYSEKNVSKVLSQAVEQVESVADFGIAALNIDDLCPENGILQAHDLPSARNQLENISESFVKEHERHFRKYLSKGRLINAMVASTVIADVKSSKPQFLNISDYLCWSIDGLDEMRMRAINVLMRSLTGSNEEKIT